MSVEATVQRVLNNANPNSFPSALQQVALGDVLSALATPVTETLALSSGTVTLADTPLAGTLVVTGVHNGSPVLFQEQLTGSLASTGYSIDGKVLTFGSGVSGTDAIHVKYLKLVTTQDTLNTDTGLPV